MRTTTYGKHKKIRGVINEFETLSSSGFVSIYFLPE